MNAQVFVDHHFKTTFAVDAVGMESWHRIFLDDFIDVAELGIVSHEETYVGLRRTHQLISDDTRAGTES